MSRLLPRFLLFLEFSLACNHSAQRQMTLSFHPPLRSTARHFSAPHLLLTGHASPTEDSAFHDCCVHLSPTTSTHLLSTQHQSKLSTACGPISIRFNGYLCTTTKTKCPSQTLSTDPSLSTPANSVASLNGVHLTGVYLILLFNRVTKHQFL